MAMDSSSRTLYQERNSKKSDIRASQNGLGEKGESAVERHPKVDYLEPFLPVVLEQRGTILTDDVAKEHDGTADGLLENSEKRIAEGPEVIDGKGELTRGAKVTHSSKYDDKHSVEFQRPGTLVQSTVGNEKEPATSISPLPTFYPSKDLFVRAVYFDDRPRDGHQNTSVFLVVCIRNITDNNLIVGCQVDERKARKFSVKLIGETPLWRVFYNQINHEEVLVHCYDLPVKNGSNGYIMYKMSKHSNVVMAASERPLVIPAPRIKPSSAEGVKYNMTIITCAKVFENPPWLEEWLLYQRTLGVDHVHLDIEDSFVRRNGLSKPFIKKAMVEGFLSVDVWNSYLGMWEIWYHNQGLIYEDCPYRFRGTYDYIIMLDTDDFLTLRKPDEVKLHYYIDTFCRGKGVGSCRYRWVEYFPDVFGFSNVSTADGNITRSLRNYSHFNQGNPKSLHRTTVLIDTATHYAFLMMPGFKSVDVPINVAYVAHLRKHKNIPERGLVAGLPNTCSEHLISRLLLALTIYLVSFITHVTN